MILQHSAAVAGAGHVTAFKLAAVCRGTRSVAVTRIVHRPPIGARRR
jgi:hypothetical protein